MRVQDVLREGEDSGAGSGAAGAGGGKSDDLIPRTEAIEAFKARDKAKAALRELQESGLVLTKEQKDEIEALRAEKAKAEEDRQKKAGEFDTLRVTLLKQHEAQLQAEREKAAKAEQDLSSTLKGLAFAQASDWFGDSGKTVLTPEIAEAFYGRYVELDGRTVVVKDADGHVILDAKTGKPAAFSDAIGQLIQSLPNKEHVLRGSGKTGSGSSGGSKTSESGEPIDIRRPLKPSEFRDPKVRAALKDQMAAAGGLQSGAGFRR
jgi:hypothetical protein